MADELLSLLSGEVLEEDVELTLAELCRTCQVPAEQLLALVEEGVVEPLGRDPAHWRFRGISVRRVTCALRLERDLGVNVAGAALALELLEELEAARARLRRFGG
jgi:chaperone modulatory protein CbpM